MSSGPSAETLRAGHTQTWAREPGSGLQLPPDGKTWPVSSACHLATGSPSALRCGKAGSTCSLPFLAHEGPCDSPFPEDHPHARTPSHAIRVCFGGTRILHPLSPQCSQEGPCPCSWHPCGHLREDHSPASQATPVLSTTPLPLPSPVSREAVCAGIWPSGQGDSTRGSAPFTSTTSQGVRSDLCPLASSLTVDGAETYILPTLLSGHLPWAQGH